MTDVFIASAAVSNYEGMDALVGQDGRVYLGRQEHYFPSVEDGVPSYYDNSDNSLQLVSDNAKIFHLLYGEGWPLSQRQLRRERCFTKADYIEFPQEWSTAQTAAQAGQNVVQIWQPMIWAGTVQL